MADVATVPVADKPLTVDSYTRLFEENEGLASPTLAAEMLHVSRQRVYQLCAEKVFRTVKVNDRRFVVLREVKARLAARGIPHKA